MSLAGFAMNDQWLRSTIPRSWLLVAQTLQTVDIDPHSVEGLIALNCLLLLYLSRPWCVKVRIERTGMATLLIPTGPSTAATRLKGHANCDFEDGVRTNEDQVVSASGRFHYVEESGGVIPMP